MTSMKRRHKAVEPGVGHFLHDLLITDFRICQISAWRWACSSRCQHVPVNSLQLFINGSLSVMPYHARWLTREISSAVPIRQIS